MAQADYHSTTNLSGLARERASRVLRRPVEPVPFVTVLIVCGCTLILHMLVAVLP